MKLAPRVIRVQLEEWAPWAKLALRATQAPLVFKAQMDSKDLSAHEAREAIRAPAEIRAPRAQLAPEAQPALAVIAETPAIQEEQAPMALPAVVVQQVQEATPAQPDSQVPQARQDLVVPLAPPGLKAIRAPRAPLVTKAPQDNADKPATLARTVFPASQAEPALRVHAATQVIRATRVQLAEPDKQDVKADKETEATRVLQESREQMAPSAPEVRVLPKAIPVTRAQLVQQGL